MHFCGKFHLRPQKLPFKPMCSNIRGQLSPTPTYFHLLLLNFQKFHYTCSPMETSTYVRRRFHPLLSSILPSTYFHVLPSTSFRLPFNFRIFHLTFTTYILLNINLHGCFFHIRPQTLPSTLICNRTFHILSCSPIHYHSTPIQLPKLLFNFHNFTTTSIDHASSTEAKKGSRWKWVANHLAYGSGSILLRT